MAPVKMFCLRKHVHGAALPFRGAALAPGQFRHDGLGVHAASKHMAMIAVAGDGLIAFRRRHYDAGDDRLLTNVEMAKTADETHAIHLPGFFLEPADEQHVAKGGQFLFLAESGAVRARVLRFPRRGFAADGGRCGGHEKPFCKAGAGNDLKIAQLQEESEPSPCGFGSWLTATTVHRHSMRPHQGVDVKI